MYGVRFIMGDSDIFFGLRPNREFCFQAVNRQVNEVYMNNKVYLWLVNNKPYYLALNNDRKFMRYAFFFFAS